MTTEKTDSVIEMKVEPTQPEQKVGDVAPPEGDQSQESKPEGEPLSDDQKTVKKLLRRIDRLTARNGAASNEARMLREQVATLSKPEQTEDAKPLTEEDIDRIASQRANDMVRRQSVAQRANAVLESGKGLEGFDAAVNAVAEEVPFTNARGQPTPFIEAVLDSDDPAALLHYLGNNPDEAADFADLSPAQIGRRLAKLEVKLASEPKKKPSAAPKPLSPVTPKAGGSGEPSDGDSVEDWVAKERARIKHKFGKA